jgi:hypothetical protein
MNIPMVITFTTKKAVEAITYQLVKLFSPTTSIIHIITMSPALIKEYFKNFLIKFRQRYLNTANCC